MKEPLVVKLPSEGTLMRDFVSVSLNYIGEESHVNLEWLGDEVKITASMRLLETAFRSLYERSADLAKKKAEGVRMGILRNDKNVFLRLLGTKKDKDIGTYLDVATTFLKKSSYDIKLSSFNKLERHANGIKLGDGGFAALNFLVTEKYECGLEFERLNFRLRFRIELDKAWYSLVLAGFALCTSTKVDEDILFVYPPEDFIRLGQTNIRLFDAIRRSFGGFSGLQEKTNNVLYDARCIGEPFPATMLFLSLKLSEETKKNGSLDILRSEDINSLPLSLCRLRRTGNVFTIVDRRRVELSNVLRFSSNLAMRNDRSVEELGRICRRTIQLASGRFRPRRDEPDFTVYNRFTTLLLQAIEQAYSAYEIVYYGSRYGLISRTLGEDIIGALSAIS
ncbi:MAG: hypothetical protein QXX08_10835 [Candidatus Bathyarchaeia archaeon]